MSKRFTFKRQILLTTTLFGAALASYGRRAYASCVNSGGTTYLCSGANASGQYINANNASVSTATGFGVNTSDADGISITGDGTLSFTDDNASSITATNTSYGYPAAGISIYGTGNAGGTPGSINIVTNANSSVTGLYDGILANNQGAGSITVSADGHLTGGVGQNNFGIIAFDSALGTSISITTGADSLINSYQGIGANNRGSGSLTITANGIINAYQGIVARNYSHDSIIITGVDSTINAITYGIYARNFNGSGSITITTDSGSTVTGVGPNGRYGIDARNQGSGAITITANGDVTGGYTGIFTRNYGTNLSVTTGTGTSITGYSEDGIYALNHGSGALNINVSGNVTAGNYGIYAKNFGTNLTVTTASGTTITGLNNGPAIQAYNNGTGALIITANGDISGSGGGISANNSSNGTNLSITTGTASTVTGGTLGIYAINHGTGALSINIGGDITAADAEVVAFNSPNGTDINITTGAGHTVSGTIAGISVYNNQYVSPTYTHPSSGSYGIFARGYSNGAVTVTAHGNVTGGQNGIYVYNGGSGASSIITSGAVSGTNHNGIEVFGNAAALTITTGPGAVTGHDYGIFTNNGGAVSITTTGAVSGTTFAGIGTNSFGGLTLTTGLGAVAGHSEGIYAHNNGGTLSITTTGAVNGTDYAGIVAQNYGTDLAIMTGGGAVTGGQDGMSLQNKGNGALSITTTGAVSGTTAAGIYAYNSNSGTALTITTGAGTVNGGQEGILARNIGSGALSINANGTVSGTSQGIYARNFGSGTLHITVNGDVTGATGIWVSYGSAAGTITNASTGSISGTGGKAVYLYHLYSAISVIIDGGHIIGDVVDSAPTNGHSTVEIAGNFTSQGSFNVSHFTIDSGKTLTLGTNNHITSQSAVADSGTLQVAHTGTGITGGLHIESGGAAQIGQSFAVSGALTNQGTTSIATGAVLTAGTMSAAASAGTLTFGVASASALGELTITGGALNLTNQTVTVDVSSSNSLIDGEALEIASGTGVIVGGPGATPTAVTDNSTAWDFTLVNGIGSGVSGATADLLYLLVQHAASQAIVISTATTTPQTLRANDSLTVTNAGSISTSGTAVQLGSGVSAAAIQNNGTITSTSGNGIAVAAGQHVIGGITNTGSITGTTALAVTGTAINDGITTSGTLHGTGGTAIALTGLTGATPLTIAGGQIIGNVTDSNPAAGYSPTTVTGDFTTGGNFNVSSFAVANGATLTLGAGNILSSQTAIADQGSIVSATDGSSVLNGGLHVSSNASFTARSSTAVNGAFTNEGTTSIASSAILTATTMSAATSAGTLVFGVVSSTDHGKLTLSGGAANLTNQTIAVSVNNQSALKGGDRILIIDGSGSITGGPGTTPEAVHDNSLLYNFSLVNGTGSGVTGADASQAYLIVAVDIPAAADTANNANAALALADAGTSNPQLTAIQSNLNNAPTPAAVNQILSSITPTVDGSAPVAAQNVSANTFDLEAVRLADLNDGDLSGSGDGTGMAAGDALDGVGMWGQAFGTHSQQDARDGIAGYDANTFGGAVGIDTRNLSDKATIGIGFSYGNTDAKSRNTNDTKTNTNSYQLSLYGDYDFTKDTYLNGLLGYSFNTIDTTRYHVGGLSRLTAQGSTNASQFSGQAELGKHYLVPTGNVDTILTPNLDVSGIHYEPNSYTETGAGGADLHVDGKDLNLVQVGAGMKAGWNLKSAAGSLKPELSVGYRYAVVNDRLEDSVTFTGGGTAFQAQGPTPARSSIDLGAALALQTIGNWTLSAQYNLELKSDYVANEATLRAAYKF